MLNTGKKYLRYLFLPNILEIFGTAKTKRILSVNPTIIPNRAEASTVVINALVYNQKEILDYSNIDIEACKNLPMENHVSWINIDGLRKADVEKIGEHFGIHFLLIEDILSINQRPKMDEVDDVLFSLMNMLYFNEEKQSFEEEQISLILGKNFVITFQDDPSKDVFGTLRARLKLPASKTRTKEVDYLYYTLIDTIVDNYYLVMDKLGEKIEILEENIIRSNSKRSLAYINNFRKEQIILKRNINPLREVISNIIKSENELLTDENEKYFKDVYDHVVQAIDLVDNYRDMIMGLQDLYISNVNLKLNEVMKVMAIVTCLLAPATVIGGIFGMNFDVIPLSSHHWGFWIAVSSMFIIPVAMLLIFKKRGWF